MSTPSEEQRKLSQSPIEENSSYENQPAPSSDSPPSSMPSHLPIDSPSQEAPPEQAPTKPPAKKSSLAFGAALMVLLSKGKTALLLLLKFGKPLLTMAVTVGAYALIYPWSFAIGLVALIFVHEMGHVWAAKRKGLPVSAPYFIPFLGAMIMMKRNPKDAVTEAYMAMGGPLLGTVGAFICYGIGVYTDSGIWHMLAYVGFFLNLFNLLPVHPLDGGRIAPAISRWMWAVGVIIGPFAIWYTHSFLLTLIWAWFVWTTYRKFKNRGQKKEGAVHYAEAVYQAEADPTLPEWYYRGSNHLRELPFTAYCRMDGQHVVEFWWDAMSFKGELPINQACTIKRVVAYGIEGPDADNRLKLKVRAEGNVYEPDNYYEVSKRARWGFGLVYGGLILTLILMLWSIQEAGWTQPVQ